MAEQSTAAGWYPDPANPGRTRWWDGTAWTEHEAPAPYTASPGFRRLPEDVAVDTVWFWILAALPALSILDQWILGGALPGLLREQRSDPFALYHDPLYLGTSAISLVVYAISVLLAWLDRRELLARGMDRPFHWAWAFLLPAVYVIGRAVVVRRRSGRGLAPLILWIVLTAIGLVSGLIVVLIVFAQILQQLPTMVTSGA